MRFLLFLTSIFFVPMNISALSFDTAQIIFHIHGSSDTNYLGRNLTSIGDVNNDGFSDIAISSKHPSGTYIYFGGNQPDTFSDLFLLGDLGASEPIDLDGDGINEIITTELVTQFPDKISILYFYKGYLDSISSTPYDSLVPIVSFPVK